MISSLRVPLRALITATLCCWASHSAVITFDEIAVGQTSFSFDGDGDGRDDVIFSTTDPFGFSTVGPGVNQSYIDEPGLEGTSILNPDLRVDFVNGATSFIAFGFALNSTATSSAGVAVLRLFSNDNLEIAAGSVPAIITTTPSGASSFPEGRLLLTFSGTAAYGLFDFKSQNGRYIIDNFEGIFGSTSPESPIPEPTSAALVGVGVMGLLVAGGVRRRRLG